MNRRLPVAALLVLLVASLTLTGCSGAGTDAPDRAAAEPTPAPALHGPDLDGTPRDLADLSGSVVVVSVWASWCGPCREELPVLDRAQRRLGRDGLVVLGLNFRDNPDAARDFVAQERPSFASVLDTDGSISVGWGVAALPQSFLVDRNGDVVDRHFGPVTDAWVDDVVAPAVG